MSADSFIAPRQLISSLSTGIYGGDKVVTLSRTVGERAAPLCSADSLSENKHCPILHARLDVYSSLFSLFYFALILFTRQFPFPPRSTQFLTACGYYTILKTVN